MVGLSQDQEQILAQWNTQALPVLESITRAFQAKEESIPKQQPHHPSAIIGGIIPIEGARVESVVEVTAALASQSSQSVTDFYTRKHQESPHAEPAFFRFNVPIRANNYDHEPFSVRKDTLGQTFQRMRDSAQECETFWDGDRTIIGVAKVMNDISNATQGDVSKLSHIDRNFIQAVTDFDALRHEWFEGGNCKYKQVEAAQRALLDVHIAAAESQQSAASAETARTTQSYLQDLISGVDNKAAVAAR